MDKDHYKDVINDYIDGKTKIQGDHPQDVLVAMDTFFHVGKMLMDNPEIETVTNNYKAAKEAADKVFLMAMQDADPPVPSWKICAAYTAVDLFGRWSIIPRKDGS